MFERVRSRNHDQDQQPTPGPDADTLQPVSPSVQADVGARGQEHHTGPADRSASALSACLPLP